MAATKDELRRWFDLGVEKGYRHMAVFMDWFDYEDYPVYFNATSTIELREQVGKIEDRLMEVYDLRMDREYQMGEARAFHWIF